MNRLWYLPAAILITHCSTIRAESRFPVAMVTRDYVDDERKNWEGSGPRPLTTVIWYPAAPEPKPTTEWGDPKARELFVAYPLAQGAELSRKLPRYPVVLLSHGSTGQAMALGWLGTHFASRGYIAAAVNHHGNTSAEKELLPQGFLFMWERARDLSVVLDKLLADPVFGAHLDGNRVVAAGHSSGGETVIELAGGIFDSRNLRAFCGGQPKDPVCDVPAPIRDWLSKRDEKAKSDPVVGESARREGRSFKDPRIKAVFSMGPAVGVAYTRETLSAIDIPVHIVVGDADDITPPATNGKRFAELIPGGKITIFPKAGHMVFGSECTALGEKTFAFCRDPEGVDRVALHKECARLAEELFDRALGKK